MSGEEIFSIIFLIGLIGWIPIGVFFDGIAKVVAAFKGDYTCGNGINIDVKHDSDDEEE